MENVFFFCQSTKKKNKYSSHLTIHVLYVNIYSVIKWGSTDGSDKWYMITFTCKPKGKWNFDLSCTNEKRRFFIQFIHIRLILDPFSINNITLTQLKQKQSNLNI